MAILDDVTSVVKSEIVPTITNNVFCNDPFLLFLRNRVKIKFDGGVDIREPFYYAPLNGKFHTPGAQQNIALKSVWTDLIFPLKWTTVPIVYDQDRVAVLARGKNAVLDYVVGLLDAGRDTLSSFMAIALYLNAQDAGYSPFFNGLTEIVNDGVTSSWNGNTYTQVGTGYQSGGVPTRNVAPINVAINGFVNNKNASGTPAPILYSDMTEAFAATDWGYGKTVKCITTTPKAFAYVKERFQTQWRLPDGKDPEIDLDGMKFEGATIFKSRYAPGSYISGTGDPTAVALFQQTSAGPGGSSLTAYPTVTGETMWGISPDSFKFWISADPEYAMGLGDWIPGQLDSILVAKLRFAGAVTCNAPRQNFLIHSFTS